MGQFSGGSVMSVFHSGMYKKWRTNRINKLEEILGGHHWFKNKKVLELGCAYGHTGKTLMDYVADVLFAEPRLEYHEHIRGTCKCPDCISKNVSIIQLDQNSTWSLWSQFDLIIHWGVLYHLENWEQDLTSALNHGRNICLESEVIDSPDPFYVMHRKESGPDQSCHGKGSFPSYAAIERVIQDHPNFLSYQRYDDRSLNAGHQHYDWKAVNHAQIVAGRRRFWMIKTTVGTWDYLLHKYNYKERV